MEGLGELPPGWAWARLGDLGRWTGGGTPSKGEAAYWSGGIIPWVSPKDMKAERVGRAAERITKAAVRGSAAKLVPRGSVLCVIRSGILQHTFPVALSACRVTLNQDMRALTPRPGISARYLQLFLRLRNDAILHDCAKDGTTVASINVDRLARLSVPVAPKEEQERIVGAADTLFTALDEAEAALARARRGLAEYRASLLHAACTGQLTAAWRASQPAPAEDGPALLRRILAERRAAWERAEVARLTAKGKPAPKGDAWKARHQEPPLPDSEDLPQLPKGWVWASIDQLMAEPARNGISVEGRPAPPGTPALRLDALTTSGLRFDRCRYIEIPAAKASALFIVAGDFLVSRANGSLHLVGRGCLASQPPQPTVFPDTMIRLRFARSCIGVWVSLLWQARLIRQQFERRAKTTAGIWKISQEDLQATLIPLPSEPEIAEASRQIAAATMDSSELPDGVAATLRQSILHAAFTGRLVPQDPADEPAAALLARLPPSRARRPRTQAAPS